MSADGVRIYIIKCKSDPLFLEDLFMERLGEFAYTISDPVCHMLTLLVKVGAISTMEREEVYDSILTRHERGV